MTLDILTPEQTYFSGEVTSVTLPGELGYFQILKNQAPVISSLKEGKLKYVSNGQTHELKVKNGFAEVHQNTITVCLEKIYEKQN